MWPLSGNPDVSKLVLFRDFHKATRYKAVGGKAKDLGFKAKTKPKILATRPRPRLTSQTRAVICKLK